MRGWLATLIRDGPFFGLYFYLYEVVVRLMKGGDLSTPNTPL